MPRHPSFYLWGAIAGFALWLTHAPHPFPVLAVIVMVAGASGCATSLAYLYYFDHRRWDMKVAAGRRFVRALGAFAAHANHIRGVAAARIFVVRPERDGAAIPPSPTGRYPWM